VLVQVQAFANLVDRLPDIRGSGAAIDLPDGTTVGQLRDRLRLPSDLPCLVLVNGHEAGPEVRLRPGDVVRLLPPLVGGAPGGA
jgi:molybdopterin converting factor small subunit